MSKHVEVNLTFDAPDTWVSGVFTPHGGLLRELQFAVGRHINLPPSEVDAIVHYHHPNTDKEEEMNTQLRETSISEMSQMYKLPEMCDDLNALLGHLVDETDVSPINVHLQNAITCVKHAIDSINTAEQQMHTYSQTRADRPMIEAISKAIHKAFDNERNVGPANGMLQDIAASGDVILAAIRGAGYVISPEPPF